MPSTTSLIYRYWQTFDNTAATAGRQWLHALWNIYQYLFVDCLVLDAARWRLVACSPVAASWVTATNIVDNSWFVAEAFSGRNKFQIKFQATNIAVLDEAPGLTYSLVASFNSAGGWFGKGSGNGGFSSSALDSSTNILLGGSSYTASPVGEISIMGDRDTLLIAISPTGKLLFLAGGYLGRFEAVPGVKYPECVLGCWNGVGVPKGFSRDAGGCFSTVPASSFVLNASFPPVGTVLGCYTSEWLNGSQQPDLWTGAYSYRPIEISAPTTYLGMLRFVWGCGGLTSRIRIDYKRKLVYSNGSEDTCVACKHNGLKP